MYTVKLVRTHKNAILPTRGSERAAGLDVYAVAAATLYAGGRAVIQTGWDIQPPPGTEVQVRPRSGLALRKGITVLNSPGTIDEDYQGPLGVILHNTTDDIFSVKPGDRIAQIVVTEVPPSEVVEVLNFGEKTERGSNGFGSTGT